MKLKFLNWMQNKFNGGQGMTNRPNPVSISNIIKKEPPKEEFSDWPHGLLAIGTFGNTDLNQKQETLQEEQCSSPIADIPLDRFLNCPSSLEADRIISNKFSTNSDYKDEEEIDRTIRIILGRCKDVSEKKKSIGAKSLSFLFKKMFVCRNGFVTTPNLRDSLQESRMEKRLRTMLTKKIYPQNASRASSTKKYIEDNKLKSKVEKEDESHHKSRERSSKWVKTDSEFIILEI